MPLTRTATCPELFRFEEKLVHKTLSTDIRQYFHRNSTCRRKGQNSISVRHFHVTDDTFLAVRQQVCPNPSHFPSALSLFLLSHLASLILLPLSREWIYSSLLSLTRIILLSHPAIALCHANILARILPYRCFSVPLQKISNKKHDISRRTCRRIWRHNTF